MQTIAVNPMNDVPPEMFAVMGSAAATLANRSGDSKARKAMDGIIGAITGVSIGPACADLAGAKNAHAAAAVCFAAGLAGLAIVTFAMDWLKAGGLKSAVASWLRRWVNMPPPGPPGPPGAPA
jgi:hypothetical protein